MGFVVLPVFVSLVPTEDVNLKKTLTCGFAFVFLIKLTGISDFVEDYFHWRVNPYLNVSHNEPQCDEDAEQQSGSLSLIDFRCIYFYI